MMSNYIYWASTILLSALYFSSAALYLTKKAWVRDTLSRLDYPATYLIPFMIVIKILGPIAILSRISMPISDLAYAGIFFHLLLSGMAHLGVRKPLGALPAVIGLALLVVSFSTQNSARTSPSPYGEILAESFITP
ncbi:MULTISPECIES: DoxX family protein [Enterobacterales]|nr:MULTISPECIES: DoxX family protein [Enterobacteriaceae]HDT4647844.1 DoxX family protein [Citrobacter freundii]KKY70005.1 membrane protein [Klebsiella michiganensis]MBJ8866075.1 DoxX family protein [Citrobacter koseri]MBL4562462.1 DoxX family protein [Citrobacter koseri]MEB2702646.1 DoxX family protein [Citrobacter koseri]